LARRTREGFRAGCSNQGSGARSGLRPMGPLFLSPGHRPGMEAEDPSRGGLKGRAMGGCGGGLPREANERRRSPRRAESGLRRPPRIRGARLSAAAVRPAGHVSTAEVCAAQDPGHATRPASAMLAFRRWRLASRGEPRRLESRPRWPRHRRPASQGALRRLDAAAPRSVDPPFARPLCRRSRDRAL
jgi:hypothetical protein